MEVSGHHKVVVPISRRLTPTRVSGHFADARLLLRIASCAHRWFPRWARARQHPGFPEERVQIPLESRKFRSLRTVCVDTPNCSASAGICAVVLAQRATMRSPTAGVATHDHRR
jgi:hypothetical protein